MINHPKYHAKLVGGPDTAVIYTEERCLFTGRVHNMTELYEFEHEETDRTGVYTHKLIIESL